MGNTTIPAELVAINAIQGTLIADNAITAVHIAQNQVHSVQLAINSVTATQIADGTITSAKIQDGTIATADIADVQITTAKLADNSVTSAKIVNASIVSADIANNAILTQHIDDNQITADQIADNAVGLGQMAGLTRGSIIYGDSAGDPAYLAAGSSGHVLTSDGTDISWTADTDLFLASSGGTVTGKTIISNSSATGGELLELIGGSSLGAGIIYNRDNSFTWYAGVGGGSGTGSIPLSYFGIVNKSQATLPFVIAHTTDRVGIGNSNPNSLLHIGDSNAEGSSANPALQIGGASTYRLGFYTDSEGGIIQNLNGDDGLQFRVKTAGEAMRIDGGTGNVGIGTSSPSYKADVQNSGNNIIQTTGVISGGVTALNLRQSRGSLSSPTNSSTNGDGNYIVSQIYRDAGYNSNAWIGLVTDANANDGRIVFGTASSGTVAEKMRIDSSGNVGIGTDNPTKLLHVNGQAQFENNIVLNENTPALVVPNGDFRIFTGGSETLRISSGRNLKFIAQTTNFESPGFTYHTNNYLYLRGGSAGLILSDDAGQNTIQISDAGDYIRFETTDGSERMRITSTGNILIGGYSGTESGGSGSRWINLDTPGSNTYSSGLLYKINGAVKAYHYLENDMLMHQTTSGVGQKFYGGTSEAMRITSTGNVGIGTQSPGAKLEVSGKDDDAGATDLLRLQFDNSPADTGMTFTDIFSGVKSRFTIDSSNTNDLRISSATKIHLYGGTTNGTSAASHLSVDENGRVGINSNLASDDLKDMMPANTLHFRREGYHGGNKTHYGRTFKYSEGNSWVSAVKIDWNNPSWGAVNMRIKGQGYYHHDDAFDVVIGFQSHAANATASYSVTSNGPGTYTQFINIVASATGETTIQQRNSNNTSNVEDIVYMYEWVTNNRSDQEIKVLDL